ncbi:MAG: FAD-binding protein [Desulfobacteraceae bacterium]|jgi:hypothetical protein
MDDIRVEITVEPDQVDCSATIRRLALGKAGMPNNADVAVRVVRRSVDARSKIPKFVMSVAVESVEKKRNCYQFSPKPLTGQQAIVVGSGPAGYFAALRLLEGGVKPIVLERGKDVTSRRKDIKLLYSPGVVNPHSNYCFGEGGAGTYSDGKLYTRATKRGNVDRILDMFVAHGASPDIRIDAHPHVGSNVLPRVVKSIRETIIQAGGEVRFDAFVDDILIENGQVKGVRVNGYEILLCTTVILATGHSARDIYRLMVEKNVPVEAKAFALGVRIEHPQELIDRIFYRQSPRHPNLPPASYRIACQVEGRGVYSFCMCPGGYVVPASTAPGELVLNGMSMAGRGGPFANAGLVVELRLEDMGIPDDPLAALRYQAAVEQTMFDLAKTGDQRAPAQTVGDFLKGTVREITDKSSYVPGVFAAPLHELLPTGVVTRLQTALKIFGKKYKGFDSDSAKLLAVESRTSSPVRIIRDPVTLMSPSVQGLYPCGEGAGYAGGIVSAAMDGERVAEQVILFV